MHKNILKSIATFFVGLALMTACSKDKTGTGTGNGTSTDAETGAKE